MAHATELNTSPAVVDRGHFGMQMEGVMLAGLFAVCFVWMHLSSGAELTSVRILVTFFSGLIVVPLLTGLPIVFVRRMMMDLIRSQPTVKAFATFSHLGLYALQGVLVWVVTREGYNWAISTVPAS